MSAKWRRVQAWDREHLTGVLTPVRLIIGALSTITLAVVLLVGISLYSVLASVPIGMLALGLTWLMYIAVCMAAVAVPALGLAALGRALVKKQAPRFVATIAAILTGGIAGALVWVQWIWPALRFDEVYGTGFRLFPQFVAAYQGTTLRRLPAFEMTELEFYAWWPMQAMLILFVTNMIVATIRRIEFKFVNIGVLTVHTGIVTIAVGSLYYQVFKQEGDTLLVASSTGGVGQAQQAFFDREDPALWVNAGMGWEQRPLGGKLPRYNDYSLLAGTAGVIEPIQPELEPGRPLRIETRRRDASIVPEDITLSIVGYATYAEPATMLIEQDPPRSDPRPVRRVFFVIDRFPEGMPMPAGAPPISPDEPQRFAFLLQPDRPNASVVDLSQMSVQSWRGIESERWAMLADESTLGGPVSVTITVPAAAASITLTSGDLRRPVEVADSGWTVTLEQVLPEPPFPIVTEGYRDTTSSVAMVRVEPPEGAGEPFTRWVYHRFPEISQDILDDTLDDGRPNRRDPDPAIDIHFIDQSQLFQVYLNEHTRSDRVDLIVRWDDGLIVREGLRGGDRVQLPYEGLSFEVGTRWADVIERERPIPVPAIDQEGDFIGRHDRAMMAVEVSTVDADWSRTVWLPFARYSDLPDLRASTQRRVELPDGRWLALVFGRVQQRLPGFQLRLIDFEMLAYDHRGAPRDYQSLVRVEPLPDSTRPSMPYDHVTKLNAPLKAPFLWSDSRPLVSNLVGEILSHLQPTQFKFSQAGWDRQGWEESQELVDQGLLERPAARFTILGVGNNPGIHVIALGGVLMGVGIPWAFYVKPWLLRRKKLRIQRELAEATSNPAARPAEPATPARQTETIGAPS
ncbi:MAG: phage holin family protein [Planctomycetota bacterium]